MAEQEEFDPFAPKEEFDPFAPGAVLPETKPETKPETLGPIVADMGQDDTLDVADQAPATDADMLQVSEIALEPNIPLGPGGETGLEAFTKRMTGLPIGREALTMIGAMTGQTVTTVADALLKKFPGSGRVLSEATGASTGAAVGSLTFDTLDTAVRFLQNDPEQQLLSMEGAGQTLGQTVKETGLEMAAQSAGKALQVFPRAIKAGVRKLFGTDDPRAVELASLAARYKVPLGIGQASQGNFKGVARVLGVIPFVGTPMQKGAIATDKALSEQLFRMLNAFSPRVSSTLEMSQEIVDASAKKFELFNTTSNALYRRFFDMTQQLPADKQAIIPTTSVREAAQQIMDIARSGGMATGGLAESAASDAMRIQKMASAIEQFPKMVTPLQYKKQMQILQDTLESLKGNNINIDDGVVLKAAFEKDLNNSVLNFAGKFKDGVVSDAADAISGRDIANQLKKANSFFHKGMLKFESPVAKRMGRVDRNIFRNTWKQLPTKEKDAMFNDIFNLKSKDAIKDLRKLVGAKTLHKSLRTLVDNNINKSKDILINNLFSKGGTERIAPSGESLINLQKVLNLGTKEGDAVLEETLKFSGVDATEFKDILKLASVSADFFIPNASVFMQRRVTLGGLGALFTVGQIGGSTSGLGVFPSIYLMRMGSKGVMNPKNLKTFTQVADNSLSPRVRRAALARIVQDLNSIAEDKESPPIDENMAQQLLRTGEEAVSMGEEAVDSGAKAVKSIQSSISPRAMEKIRSAVQ